MLIQANAAHTCSTELILQYLLPSPDWVVSQSVSLLYRKLRNRRIDSVADLDRTRAAMRSVADPLHVSRFLQVYDLAAAKNGIRLSIGFDFHEYVSITRATPTKGSTYPCFRPDRSTIKLGEGYWIIGVDNNNEVALLEAARLFDLSRTNFAEHLISLKAFYADPTLHAHPQDRCTCIAPSAQKMTGKVAYHGDRWVRRDLRGQGISKIMTGIARGVSFAMWAPDFLCALVPRQRLDKGGVYGYAHCEPGGSILQLIEEDIVDDDWLVWLSGDELRSLVDDHDIRKLSVASPVPPVSSGGI